MDIKFPPQEFWDTFRETNGALSCSEAIAIYNISALAPIGLYMELGTHKGKSAMAATIGLKDGVFILVDPIFDDKELVGELADNVLAVSSIGRVIIPIAENSLQVIPYHDYYSYVFVDSGSHQDGLPMQEVKLLEDRIVEGGIIAFHDFKSQFVEVEVAYNYLVSTGKYEEIKIDWDTINKYSDENNLEDGTNKTWHHTELKNPNFVGALKRK
jgi:hypothetical protein